MAIMPNPRAWGLTVFSNPSVLGLADMPNPNAWGLAVMSCLDVCCWLKAFGCGTIWKRQKHPYMQTCFCWVPRVISYSNCFNEMKRWWSPSTQTYIFPFFGVWMYLHCLIFSKTKKAPNPKVKILYLKGLIKYLYHCLKNPKELLCPQSIFQCQMYSMKKTIAPQLHA